MADLRDMEGGRRREWGKGMRERRPAATCHGGTLLCHEMLRSGRVGSGQVRFSLFVGHLIRIDRLFGPVREFRFDCQQGDVHLHREERGATISSLVLRRGVESDPSLFRHLPNLQSPDRLSSLVHSSHVTIYRVSLHSRAHHRLPRASYVGCHRSKGG